MASRKIEDLTPRMQEKIIHFEEELEKAVPGVFHRSCTYRSQAEQNALWKRGRCPLDEVNAAYKAVGMAPITAEENRHQVTWKTISDHTCREAVDYFILRDGKYCNDLKVDTDGDKIEDWQEFGRVANECGLEWGGNWKKKDIPHVQWRD
jgi:peptidoglycan LD-endopeptidase CwlK